MMTGTTMIRMATTRTTIEAMMTTMMMIRTSADPGR